MTTEPGFAASRALARYASHPHDTRGRRYREEESALRTVYQRDRDRIVHSTAFRRLKYKTQVFVYHEGDHYRTRLTHSLEVAQISRSLARVLGLDEDLSEALALAHESRSRRRSAMPASRRSARRWRPHGGFDHNGQTLRILAFLESRYAAFDGLNLTWETLEGVARAQRPAARRRPHADRPALGGGGVQPVSRSRAFHMAGRGGANRPPSPTRSPTTPTISMTACAPSYSIPTICVRCPWSGPIVDEGPPQLPRDRASTPGPRNRPAAD